MPSVCLYFQIHQPFRLRKYTVFDSDAAYFDVSLNARLVKRIADRCYRPANNILLELLQHHRGKFRVAFSITGTAMEQLELHAPEVVHGLHDLAQTGHVEFLAETFHHSLAALYSPKEFIAQVALHAQMIKRLFGIQPTTFRNTELIYSNAIGAQVSALGYTGILAEGWEPLLNHRSAAFPYRALNGPLTLLLRNYALSDAIAFRFSDPRSPDFPLTPEKFAAKVSEIGGQLCNLFMDYETFGEHQAASTGILDFLRAMPAALFEHNADFLLPRDIVAHDETAGELDVPEPISWADEHRDLSAWAGNAMQKDAIDALYKLEPAIKAHADPKLIADWRKLTTSDHVYYMATKSRNDGQVHAHFRPYDSPYDAYINFMNVLDNLRARAS
jgi:alpha-amylase